MNAYIYYIYSIIVCYIIDSSYYLVIFPASDFHRCGATIRADFEDGRVDLQVFTVTAAWLVYNIETHTLVKAQSELFIVVSVVVVAVAVMRTALWSAVCRLYYLCFGWGAKLSPHKMQMQFLMKFHMCVRCCVIEIFEYPHRRRGIRARAVRGTGGRAATVGSAPRRSGATAGRRHLLKRQNIKSD